MSNEGESSAGSLRVVIVSLDCELLMLLQITFRVLICQDDGQPSDILHTFRPFSSIQTKVKVLKPV